MRMVFPGVWYPKTLRLVHNLVPKYQNSCTLLTCAQQAVLSVTWAFTAATVDQSTAPTKWPFSSLVRPCTVSSEAPACSNLEGKEDGTSKDNLVL